MTEFVAGLNELDLMKQLIQVLVFPHFHYQFQQFDKLRDFTSKLLGLMKVYTQQASTLTQNFTGRVGPVTPIIYWSRKVFISPTHFSLT